jgi:hypothetical protein
MEYRTEEHLTLLTSFNIDEEGFVRHLAIDPIIIAAAASPELDAMPRVASSVSCSLYITISTNLGYSISTTEALDVILWLV